MMIKRLVSLCLALIILLTGICFFYNSNNITLMVKKTMLGNEDFEKQDRAINAFIDAFNNEYPQINVKINYVNEYPAHLNETELILFGADEMLEYAPNDLKVLTDIVSTNNIPEKIANTGRLAIKSDKKDLYMLPFNYDRAVVYLDKEVFDFLGVDIPSVDWTYEDFKETAQNTTRRYFDYKEYKNILGVHLPIGKAYVWKYFYDNLGDEWHNDSFRVEFNTDKNLKVMEDVLDLCKKNGKCYSMTLKSSALFYAETAMAWVNACQPEYDDYRIISDEVSDSLVGRRAKQLAANGNLVLLPLPSVNGTNMSYSNTEFIKGIGISAYISHSKMENAVKLVQFAQTYKGNSALNSYYGGIPSNESLWGEEYWKKGCLQGENADNVLIGIENDKRDDYADILIKDEAIYEKNLRLRAISAGLLLQEFRETQRNIKNFEEIMNRMARYFNMTIKNSGIPDGFNRDIIKREEP